MKISVNRLCRLAGLPTSTNQPRLVRESKEMEEKDHSYMEESSMEIAEDMEESYMEEADDMEEAYMEGSYMDEDMEESDCMEEADDMEEMIEVDEKMLVQELRRAKNLMKESALKRQRQSKSKENLLEAELKKIIESEVSSVMKDLNLTGGWVYGKNKPKRSKQGYTHQGSYLKGIGFK